MLSALWRTLRPRQWVKNLFVLAPLVFAKSLRDPQLLLREVAALLVFCALSSAVYLLNDILDRERDRLHPLKRFRPIAAGQLSVPAATTFLALLAVGSLAGAFALGIGFLIVAAIYLGINILYSSGMKHIVILDVMAVSAGYVLRVQAGSLVIDVEVSTWLLLCTTFLALFLTLSKRRHELVLLQESAADQRQVLDHYSPAFLDQMMNVVTASTLIAYALYATAPETAAKVGSGALIYTIPFAIFGIFRYLYLTYQVSSERNPTESMLTDLPFVVNLVLWGIAVLMVLYV